MDKARFAHFIQIFVALTVAGFIVSICNRICNNYDCRALLSEAVVCDQRIRVGCGDCGFDGGWVSGLCGC